MILRGVAALAIFLGVGATAWAQSGQPVGLVEEADGIPGEVVGFMDYVYSGQTINLGPSGRLVLTSMDGCRAQTVTGGTATIGKGGAVTGANVSKRDLPCDVKVANVSVDAREAGGVIARLALFKPGAWKERIVRGDPVFKWNAAAFRAPVRVQVFMVDSPVPRLVFQSNATRDYLVYANSGQPVRRGMPYQVFVTGAGGKSATTLFSTDPDLDVSNSWVNRLVHVGR